jgi:Ca2+-binding RTX toxin-like protein
MRRLLTLAILLVLPASAHAGTVSLGPKQDEYFSGPTVEFVAARGEANRVTVTAAADGGVVIRDTGAPIVARAPCLALGTDAVRCVAPVSDESGPIEAGFFGLGDGDDSIALRVAGAAHWGSLGVRGGAGDDTLDLIRVGSISTPKGGFSAISADGGAGKDSLLGSAGEDALTGGGDDDGLAGRGGSDTLVGDGSGTRGKDVMRGGRGEDTVSYESRRASVLVDLAAGRGGAAGREDRLSGVEDAIGGSGRDVLLGDRGRNSLQGSGDLAPHRRTGDSLAGRGGDDTLLDFGGPSRLDGGAGADELVGVRAEDRLRCGPGADRLAEATQVDVPHRAVGVFVPTGCERVDTGFYGFGHGVVRSGRLVISTRPIGRGGECRVDLSVRGRSGARLGHVSFRGRHRRLAVALSPAGRRAARRHGVVRIVTEERCADTFDVWRIRL